MQHCAKRLNVNFVDHYRKDADTIDMGISTIMESAIAFARVCINKAGIDGFFYELYGCESLWMTEDEFTRWSLPHDKRILSVMREA